MTAILLRWARNRRGRAGAAARPARGEAGSRGCARRPRPAERIAGLDTALGLSRMLGKKSLYLAMLRRYVAGQAHVVRDIREAWRSGDKATAERLAHTTKAVSGNIGATLVQDRAAALEGAIRQGSEADDVERLVCELEVPLWDLLRGLEAFLGAPPIHLKPD